MKSALFCLLLLPILSACNGPQIKWPKVEECIISILPSGSACICDDQRGDDGAVVLPIEACDGHLSVSPSDYSELFNFATDVTARLEVCLRFPKKCQ